MSLQCAKKYTCYSFSFLVSVCSRQNSKLFYRKMDNKILHKNDKTMQYGGKGQNRICLQRPRLVWWFLGETMDENMHRILCVELGDRKDERNKKYRRFRHPSMGPNNNQPKYIGQTNKVILLKRKKFCLVYLGQGIWLWVICYAYVSRESSYAIYHRVVDYLCGYS